MKDSMADTSFSQNNTREGRPRRVLIFSLAYYPRFVGGAEVAIKGITDRISADEIVFDMITAKLALGQVRFEKIGNVNVHRVGFGSSADKFLFPILGTFKTLSLMRRTLYDQFWAMMVTYSSGVPYMVNILRKLVGKKKVPVVLTLQEGDSEEHIRNKSFGLAGMLWRLVLLPVTIFLPSHFRKLGMIGISWALALKRTDHVTVISNYLEKQARNYGYTGPVTLVPNAVDFELFSRGISIAEDSELKRILDKKSGDVFLITTSRLVLKNGVADIIDSLCHLAPHVKLLILGTGVLENDLKAQVARLKLEDRVKFLGFIEHKSMPQYLHISDIFIRPSLSEGLGNSFLEAMAAGIPVIATPVGGIPDFLTDGETGLFCEVNNPHSIAQKVEKLMKDRESREYIIKNARAMVQTKYSWDHVAEDMKKIFSK